MKRIVNRFPWTLRLLAITAVLMLASYRSWSQANGGPCTQTGLETLEADKKSYWPNEAVSIHGSGFAPDCQARLELTQPDGSVTAATVTSDPAGDVVYSLSAGAVGGSYELFLYGPEGSFLAGAGYSTGAMIQSDKGDYRPGETAVITGRGWRPGETVTVDFQGATDTRTFSGTADSKGEFLNADMVFEPRDKDVPSWSPRSGRRPASWRRPIWLTAPISSRTSERTPRLRSETTRSPSRSRKRRRRGP